MTFVFMARFLAGKQGIVNVSHALISSFMICMSRMSYKCLARAYKPYLYTYKRYSHTGSAQWKNYSLEEHLFNYRAFANYAALDKKIIQDSSLFNQLPVDSGRKSKSRKPTTVFNTTTSDDSPRKKRFVVNLVDTESEDEVTEDEEVPGIMHLQVPFIHL